MAFRHLGANSRGADMTKTQIDKYIKFNDGIDLLCDATQQKMNIYVGISSGNTLTLGDEDFTENFIFHLRAEPGSPTLDGDWVFRVPATMRHFGVINDTGFLCYVESAGSPGGQVEVMDGGRASLHTDGESIEEMKRDIYDLFTFVNVVTFEAMVLGFTAVRPFKLPANLPDSFGYAWVPSGASENDRVVSIQKNEVEVGTITWSALTADATIVFASDSNFIIGDRFSLVWAAEESPDVEIGLADVGISIKAVAV